MPDQAGSELKNRKPLGIALVGLGSYARERLGPALLETRRARLVALVTGSMEKVPEWQSRHHVQDRNVYRYEDYGRLKENKEVDVVYVALPTGLHAGYVVRALEMGKHVICEKPMAATVEECDLMIAAARGNGRSLHIGYRLHWDPYYRRMMEVSASRSLGEIERIDAAFGYINEDPDPNAWTLSRKLGVAGELFNLGVYPVQAAVSIAGRNPLRVKATQHNTRPEIYREVAEGYDWVMDFGGGLQATGFASAAKEGNHVKVVAEMGGFGLDHWAFSYDKLGGYVAEERMSFPPVNQQALQIDGICEAIQTGVKSRVPGEMGRRDVCILRAVMESAVTEEVVEIDL